MTEHDGIQVAKPAASLAAARISIKGAECLLWEQPGECAPRLVPGLLREVYGVLSSMASILACLARTDLDAERRGQLRAVEATMRTVVADMRDVTQPAR